MDELEKQKLERQRLYERTRDELSANSRSMAESYDRAVLTLSSAFLGGSLAFIERIIDLKNADGRLLLYVSWALLALAIVSTVASYLHGLHSIPILRKGAEDYYIHEKDEAWKVSEKKEREAFYFLFIYGLLFVAGVVCLGLFVSVNLAREASMDKNGAHLQSQKVEKGIPPVPFQKPSQPTVTPGVGQESSIPPPTYQRPPSTPTSPPPAPAKPEK